MEIEFNLIKESLEILFKFIERSFEKRYCEILLEFCILVIIGLCYVCLNNCIFVVNLVCGIVLCCDVIMYLILC